MARVVQSQSIEDLISENVKGQGSIAARMWHHYLPHLVTPAMLRTEIHSDFILEARRIGSDLGFNASGGDKCAYEGQGAFQHLGPLFVSPLGMWDHEGFIMSETPPNPATAQLLAVTIHNIDSLNTLCPPTGCTDGSVCIKMGDVLPGSCRFGVSGTDDDDEDTDWLINISIVVIVIGMVVLIRVDQKQ